MMDGTDNKLLDFVEIIRQLSLPNDPRVLPQYTGKYVRFMITAVAISYNNILWELYEVLHKNRKMEITALLNLGISTPSS